MDNDNKQNDNKEHENKMNFYSLISGYMKDENIFIAYDSKNDINNLRLDSLPIDNIERISFFE